MQVSASDLVRTYSLKSDEELLLLHQSGTLTDVAYETLEAEMRQRSISVPARIPRDEALRAAIQSSQMTPQHRIEILKELALVVSWVPVLAVAAPLTNVYFRDDLAWIAIVMALGPMILFACGVRGLLYPTESEARPRAVLYGAGSAGLVLALAPMSLSVAIDNSMVHPSWVPFSLVGAISSAAYLWFAYRHWRNHHTVTRAERAP